jgi:hypothetical protein
MTTASNPVVSGARFHRRFRSPAPAQHHRSGRRGSRYAPSDLESALLRATEARSEAPHQGLLAPSRAEISGLFRARPAEKWRPISDRTQADLCRSLDLPEHRRTAPRLSQAHEAFRKENSRFGSAARQGGTTAPDQGLSCVGPAHPVQPVGRLPLLQGAGCVAMDFPTAAHHSGRSAHSQAPASRNGQCSTSQPTR